MSDSTYETFFDECGNERPLAVAKMAWKSELVQMLTFHFSLAKLQGAMNQFREGLGTLGVLEAIQDNAQAMNPFFLWFETKLTAGMYSSYIRLFHDCHWNADSLLNLFWQGEIVYKEVDEMMWKKEREAFILFKDFLQECEGTVIVLKLLREKTKCGF